MRTKVVSAMVTGRVLLRWIGLALFCLVSLAARAEVVGVVFQEDFEAGWADWSADNGVWQVGTPTAGPSACQGGAQCAGTVLDGNYPGDTDSRLISPSIQLPAVNTGEEIQLRFWQWFSYATANVADCDAGYVQVSVQDAGTGIWSAWATVGPATVYSSGWSPTTRDLTPYAGKTIRFAFFHSAYSGGGCSGTSFGWYVDNIEIVILGGSNHSPVMSPIADQAVAEGNSLVVPVSATDADGDPLTLSVAGLPSFATFTDNGNGTGSIAFTPGLGTTGKYVMRVTASDGSLGRLSSSDVFTLTVCTAAGDLDCDTIPDTADNCTLVPNENQRDSNGDKYGNACDPDLNNNGVVNFGDLAIMKSVFFTNDPDADLNGDGVVNFSDLAIMKSMFFKPPGPSGVAVPPG